MGGTREIAEEWRGMQLVLKLEVAWFCFQLRRSMLHTQAFFGGGFLQVHL